MLVRWVAHGGLGTTGVHATFSARWCSQRCVQLHRGGARLGVDPSLFVGQFHADPSSKPHSRTIRNSSSALGETSALSIAAIRSVGISVNVASASTLNDARFRRHGQTAHAG